jgi:predicted Zn-dependent protease
LLLQAYGQVMLSHPEYRERYWTLAKQLENTQGENVLVMEALADWALQRKDADGSSLAIRYLDSAIHQGTTNPADFEQLAMLLTAANRQSDALKILQQGMQLIPYYAEFYRLSASVNFSANRKREACEVVAKGVEKFPQDTVIQDLSKKCGPTQPASSD